MDGSVLAFLKCMDGSVLAFLKCTDGSVWTHLNGTYGSVWSHRSFRLNLLPLDFHSWGILVYDSYYARKATKLPVWNRVTNLDISKTSNIPLYNNHNRSQYEKNALFCLKQKICLRQAKLLSKRFCPAKDFSHKLHIHRQNMWFKTIHRIWLPCILKKPSHLQLLAFSQTFLQYSAMQCSPWNI